jgi:histidinol phosphatase-like enzyme
MNYMKQQSKIIAVDLDDTLCFRPEGIENLGVNKYHQCEPLVDNIEIINKLYDSGNTIIIYTARGMYTFNFNIAKIYSELYPPTLEQLEKWGVKFHQLVMGKFPYDYLLDDKAIELSNINYLTRYIQ